MPKWYRRRGGYVKLPRIPWGQRPSWYVKSRPRTTPIFRPPSYTNYVTSDLYEKFLEKLEDDKYKDFNIESIKRKHRIKRVTTVPLTPDQKKLLEVTKPKSSRKKKVQSPKGARPWKKKKFTQLESQKQDNPKEISADKMPRRKKRMVKRMFRAKRPVTRLKRWLRPPRKRSKAPMMIKSGGRGSTFSSFYSRKKYKKNKYKYVMSTFPWNKRMEVKSFRVTSTFGSQGVKGDNTMEWLSRTDLLSLSSFLSTANKTASFLVDSVKATIMIANMSKATVYLDIYEYSYRKDSDYDIANLFSNGVADAYGGGAVDRQTLFMTPFMSPRLTSAIKINSVKTIELSQGASHIHRSTRKIGRIWNMEDLYSSGSERISDWTTGTMFVQRGEPVNDSGNNVSTSSTAVDYVVKEETTIRYAEPLIKQLTYSSTLPTLTSGQLLDEGSGEVESVVAA